MDERSRLYDKLCAVLTHYEHPQETSANVGDIVDEMYNILCEIQNNWEILITAEG